jgi:deoxyhypusine monooxygenase
VTAPVALKMRAIYYLRTMGTCEAVDVLCRALARDAVPGGGHSPLMRHELAYVLGQLQDPSACPALEATLEDARGSSPFDMHCSVVVNTRVQKNVTFFTLLCLSILIIDRIHS